MCYLFLFVQCCYDQIHLQGDRERIVVRRFKFEEPRLEQIQDLEVSGRFI